MAAESSKDLNLSIIRQILKESINCEEEVLSSGAYSIDQERESREKIRQASALRHLLKANGFEDLLS